MQYTLLKLSINNFIFYIDLLKKDNDALQLFYSFDSIIKSLLAVGSEILYGKVFLIKEELLKSND